MVAGGANVVMTGAFVLLEGAVVVAGAAVVAGGAVVARGMRVCITHPSILRYLHAHVRLAEHSPHSHVLCLQTLELQKALLYGHL